MDFVDTDESGDYIRFDKLPQGSVDINATKSSGDPELQNLSGSDPGLAIDPATQDYLSLLHAGFMDTGICI